MGDSRYWITKQQIMLLLKYVKQENEKGTSDLLDLIQYQQKINK
jgi:hypothetical protein